MAAPKKWGYTRDQPLPDELLVAWTDGDLIKILDREVVERLLTHPSERERVAAWARAGHDTVEPADDGRDRIEWPRAGLVELCQRMGSDDDLDEAPSLPGPELKVAGRSVALPAVPLGTVFGVGVALAITGALVFWMLRNL